MRNEQQVRPTCVAEDAIERGQDTSHERREFLAVRVALVGLGGAKHRVGIVDRAHAGARDRIAAANFLERWDNLEFQLAPANHRCGRLPCARQA